MTITLPPHSTSPLRSSPLSKPPWPPTKTKPKRLSTGSASPSSLATLESLPIPRPQQGSPSSPSNAGSTSTCSASSPLSRSHPLLGSYHLSLLHSRMSAHAPHSVPSFSLRLKAVGAPTKCPASTPANVRCPPPLDVAFKATYYDLADGVNTPWVADVDLEAWFLSAYGNSQRSVSLGSPPPGPSAFSPPSPSSTASSLSTSLPAALPPPPLYPGYRVPPVGQLQILIRTPTSALKVFVLPYDLRELEIGGRLLARERTYVSNRSIPSTDSGSPRASLDSLPPTSPNKPGETLRYAVQLQFTCAPAPAAEAAVDPQARAFYVSRTLKLVFASRAPETSDAVRDERADELVPPPSASLGTDSRIDDWTRIRRRYVSSLRSSASTSTSSSSSYGTKKTASTRTPAAVRGFSPTRDRPSTPAAMASPRSLLSALNPRGEDDDDRSVTPTPALPAPVSVVPLSRAIASALLSPTSTLPGATTIPSPAAPTPAPTSATNVSSTSTSASTEDGGAAASAVLPRAASPRPAPIMADRRRRGSRAERELSERLRAMELHDRCA